MATTVKTAQTALEAARAAVTEWTDKAAAARAEAAELDANSGALILADPTAADDISLKVDSARRRARAYDDAAQEATQQVKAARRELLEASATQYDKDAAKAKYQLDAHTAKVDALLEQLRELDNWEYERKHLTVQAGQSYTPGVTHELLRAHRNAVNSAAYVRHYLDTGATAQMAVDLRNYGGVGHVGQPVYEVLDDLPTVVLEDRNAADELTEVSA